MKTTTTISSSCRSALPLTRRATPLRTASWVSLVSVASLGAALLLGCGAVSEDEMFSESTGALSEHLGESCESTPITDAEEVNVDGEHPSCEPGYCITRGEEAGASEGAGICSCRCDGPSGTGPFCSCGEGFSCEHLIDDTGLGNLHLTGSYCMPE